MFLIIDSFKIIALKRRDFLYLSCLTAGAGLLRPARLLAADELLMPADLALKKRLADLALNAATSKGATYADVRIGRYLSQSVNTREKRVQNISNTESYGMGIRVIANGSWGFASTDDLTTDAIARTT